MFEDFAAPIKSKVIVCRNKREDDRKRCLQLVTVMFKMLPPRSSCICKRFSKDGASLQNRTVRCQMPTNDEIRTFDNVSAETVVRVEGIRNVNHSPVTNRVANDKWNTAIPDPLAMSRSAVKYPNIAAEPVRQLVDRIVLSKNVLCPWQRSQLTEHAQQVFTIGLSWMSTEVQFVFVPRAPELFTRPGDLRWPDQSVVLQEACKHATEHPRRRNLCDVVRAPFLITLRRALGRLRLLVLGPQGLPYFRHFT